MALRSREISSISMTASTRALSSALATVARSCTAQQMVSNYLKINARQARPARRHFRQQHRQEITLNAPCNSTTMARSRPTTVNAFHATASRENVAPVTASPTVAINASAAASEKPIRKRFCSIASSKDPRRSPRRERSRSDASNPAIVTCATTPAQYVNTTALHCESKRADASLARTFLVNDAADNANRTAVISARAARSPRHICNQWCLTVWSTVHRA